MKYLIVFLLAIQSSLAISQEANLPASEQMRIAVTLSMTSVCRIDRDSRQCELFQFLFGEQIDIANGKSPEARSQVTNAVRKNLVEVSKDRKNQLNFMESENKMRLSRMYSALKQATEKICDIKLESKPCDTVLSIFIFQTDIEIGKKLNPSPEVPLKVKRDIREFIAKENSKLTESSEILVEASMLWNMRNPN